MSTSTFEFQFGAMGFLPPDAEYIKFCFERREEIEEMKRRGFWDFKKGQAICHRDDKGKLRKIDFNLLG